MEIPHPKHLSKLKIKCQEKTSAVADREDKPPPPSPPSGTMTPNVAVGLRSPQFEGVLVLVLVQNLADLVGKFSD